jgi:hypothetical protein
MKLIITLHIAPPTKVKAPHHENTASNILNLGYFTCPLRWLCGPPEPVWTRWWPAPAKNQTLLIIMTKSLQKRPPWTCFLNLFNNANTGPVQNFWNGSNTSAIQNMVLQFYMMTKVYEPLCMDIKLHTLTLTLYGGEWSASCSSCL